ncbi:SMR family transporter [Synechococcus sp. AH-707-B22]|nr:SMR family transporter [Synechococcus sp. AH-707-B22]
MNNDWLLLIVAILFEVIATSCLKLSVGMTKLWPTLLVLMGYAIAFLLLSKVVLTLPLGITYALWSGIGIISIVIIGLFAYKQVPTQGQLVGIAMITTGVIIVNLFDSHP